MSMNQRSRILNPSQALFGTLLGVWYGGMTKDVLTSTVINPSIAFPVWSVKALYIIVSFLFLCFFVNYMVEFQNNAYSFPDRFNGDFTFKDAWTHFGRLIKVLIIISIMISGFLLTTYFTFIGRVDFFVILFGAFQPPIWILLEVWLVWSPIARGS